MVIDPNLLKSHREACIHEYMIFVKMSKVDRRILQNVRS